MANEKIPRTFLTFWKFNKRKWDWHCFSKNHFINSAYVLLFQFYEYHPVWNSFSNDNPFPSSVFLSFWATCPPTTLTSTEIEIFRWISDFYRDLERFLLSLGMLRCLTGYDKKRRDVMRMVTVWAGIQPGILHDDNWSWERDHTRSSSACAARGYVVIIITITQTRGLVTLHYYVIHSMYAPNTWHPRPRLWTLTRPFSCGSWWCMFLQHNFARSLISRVKICRHIPHTSCEFNHWLKIQCPCLDTRVW